MSTRLLIVGGSDAGIAAALRAREVDPSAEVAVVVADAYPNYSICGLPFFLSGETPTGTTSPTAPVPTSRATASGSCWSTAPNRSTRAGAR